MKSLWPKAFDPETIASIQTIQDSLAGLSSLYIAVLDDVGAPLTIPSNQAGTCTECQTRYSELPCLPNFKQAIAETAANKSMTSAQCPFGLLTYFSPLGTSGNPARSNMAAILAIGKLAMADRFRHDDHPPKDDTNHSAAGSSCANTEKTVTTYCKIFDLIFSLAQHTGFSAASSAIPAAESSNALALTAREHEVLHLVALGLSNRTIADRLFISETTVKTHVHNISRKVKSNNRTSLALFFHQSMS
jgi:DNA-binding CsgD family transcriptional regulator